MKWHAKSGCEQRLQLAAQLRDANVALQDQQLEALDKEEKKDEKIAALEAHGTKRDAEIGDLKTKLAEKVNALNATSKTLEECGHQLEIKKKDYVDVKKERDDLRGELGRLNGVVAELVEPRGTGGAGEAAGAAAGVESGMGAKRPLERDSKEEKRRVRTCAGLPRTPTPGAK